MKRWLPYPLTSAALLVMWLLLNQTLYPGHWLLGAVLAIVIPLMARPLRPVPPTRMRHPLALLRLLAMSTIEIVRSAFNVGRIILFVHPRNVHSQFIRIPLDLQSPAGLAILAGLINLTPGTVWVEILPDEHVLSLHVFDLHDEQWWVDTIKTHYERPLIEVFDNGGQP